MRHAIMRFALGAIVWGRRPRLCKHVGFRLRAGTPLPHRVEEKYVSRQRASWPRFGVQAKRCVLMNTPATYVPSQLRAGEAEAARQHAFTRWMSRDLLQAATDFCKNIGHVAAYCESAKEGTRYLFWQMPAGASCEVRSARTKEKFVDFDRANQERGRRLLSLHVSEDELYSAVWLSVQHHEAGAAFLQRFGISTAEIKTE